ncbi:hypothetical protein CK203_039693 [Vitis vinifera]|uniref:Transposon Ty3-I Gag-Pol polyprotein n=1 Tax=Vitis vinifera TaxID=29760 RepID=A0A438HTZ8_VITVI|nr:hypothetical protein CK203_039693 [Vitis vinifera]
MRLPPSTLENPGRLLSGFSGATTTFLGDAVLPVQAGPITQNVQFSVMVSYFIEDGQIDLFGSQLAACQCYQVVLESRHPTNNEPHPEPSNKEGREVEYSDWLENAVVIPKKGRKWHEMLFFIDAFFGYHQIPMFQPYEEKMALVTPQGLYCYRVITFRLKNVGASAIGWKDECKWALDRVKHYLTKTPILSNSQSGKQLYMYLVMSNYVKSILQDGANDLSPQKHRPETPPILSCPPSDRTHKSTTQKHLAQVRLIQTNVEVSHRVK